MLPKQFSSNQNQPSTPSRSLRHALVIILKSPFGRVQIVSVIRAQVIYMALVYPKLGNHRIRKDDLHEVSVLGAEYG
ncbi:hypothetical protein [Microbulbifer variabilis]|uniref:hypothetical protein n=1 Tax=Microbulbifer variabilis TaxID=266805 RepID=UPI001FDF159D|nr:hypothetical protein [Microbulbifer variabilis]